MGESNLVRDDLLQNIKEVVIGVMVISIGKRVLTAKDPNNLSEFVGHITLTDDWARGILQPID